ncbi:hypothetical protein BDR06DRAFT_1005225 [Suillus hirtellus]|nr:hypothetical protein BDR06DRAFT_1005225 [Suillus hirtellus]
MNIILLFSDTAPFIIVPSLIISIWEGAIPPLVGGTPSLSPSFLATSLSITNNLHLISKVEIMIDFQFSSLAAVFIFLFLTNLLAVPLTGTSLQLPSAYSTQTFSFERTSDISSTCWTQNETSSTGAWSWYPRSLEL